MIQTTELLVASVKRRSLAPTSQKTFQDADIIAILNEELSLGVVPLILSAREDYFLRSIRTQITSGLSSYDVTRRAIGNSLKDIAYVYGTASTDKRDLNRISLSDSFIYSSTVGEPEAYFLKGDEIVLLPTPSNGAVAYLEQWFLERASQLVPTTSVTKIVGVSTVAGVSTFTVDTDLTASLSVGSLVDFLNAQSPMVLWGRDVEITAITASTIEVAAEDVSNDADVVLPGVGDYICPQLQANIPTVPEEFHPYLAERAAKVIVQGLGHNDKLSAIVANLGAMENSLMKIISNRVESDGRPIVKRNGVGSFFGSWGSRSRG